MALLDIGGEGILLAGGGRAILLQLANPAVGHAVADHSNFANDPLKRLRNTLTFVYALVFGTAAQVAAVTAFVQRAHAPVRSETYDASNAQLQLWVAATLYDTAAVVHELVFGPLSESDADAVYFDYAIVGTALGMPASLWPADRAAFARYFATASATLAVDDRVFAVSRDLLYPKTGPLWMRLAMPTVRLVTSGLLSAELRAAYRLPWSAARDRRYQRLMRITAVVYLRLPHRIREWPKNYLLRAL